MGVCIVNGCHNASQKKKKGEKVTYHLFPQDPVLADMWIKKVRENRNESWWKPTKHTKICSDHFRDSEKYITKGGLCRLHPTAIPSKNMPVFRMEPDSDSDEKNGCPEQIEPQPGTSDASNSVMDESPFFFVSTSIFDIPKKESPRNELTKKILIQPTVKDKKVNGFQQNSRRLKKRNASLQKILLKLRQKRYINNDIFNILSQNVYSAQLYNSSAKKESKNKEKPLPKYVPEFRKFCVTLHFYSPQGYIYVRNTFDTCLPLPKTIYNWYQNVDGTPGFTDEAFRLLKSKVKSANKQILCALVADEMSIRPQNLKGGQGRVDIGTGTEDNNILATEAYTFMLVCLNGHWKIPLGYFMVHGLTGGMKANLIKICLRKCEAVGVKVAALTLDGHSTNISALQLLGCRINDPENMKTTFKHPSASYDVAVFLDPCQMIKLVENYLEDKKELLDQYDNKVVWDYLTKLIKLPETGLHLANKLKSKHLLFRNSILKVASSSQLLSRSAEVALNACREDLKLKDFEDCEGTEKFVLIFSYLFDVFNSRGFTQHGFCHPISHSNKKQIFDFLEDAKNYILNLKVKSTRKRKYNENMKSIPIKVKSYEPAPVNYSPGFKGLLICIESIKHLFLSLVEDTKGMDYITTHRLSQDHIELLFGCIRLNGGNNCKPNALQFKSSYRRLLGHMEILEIKTGASGNCVPLETIGMLTCSSALACINASSYSERYDDADEGATNSSIPHTEIDGQFEVPFGHDEPNYKEHIIGYIAGNVVKYLAIRVKCQFCIDDMLSAEKLWFHALVRARDEGGLVYASKEVHALCCIAETCLQVSLKESPRSVHSEKELSLVAQKKLIGKPLFKATKEHIHCHHHNINLARLIIERYLRIRLFYETIKLTNQKRLYLTTSVQKQLQSRALSL